MSTGRAFPALHSSKNADLERFPSLPLPGANNPFTNLTAKSVVFQLSLICVGGDVTTGTFSFL